MRTEPMTTEELFNRICEILQEKGKLPDILDYSLAKRDAVEIRTCEFEIKSNLDYGSSEGIYLDLWIEFFDEDSRYRKKFGTFKTLKDDEKAMHIMAALLADFIIEERAYVRANSDDFTWEGVDVYLFNDAGKRISWHFCFEDMESALKKKDEVLDKYWKVVIRNNATREEKVYQNQKEKDQDS